MSFDQVDAPSQKLQRVIQMFLLDRMKSQDVTVKILVTEEGHTHEHSSHDLKLNKQQLKNLEDLMEMIEDGQNA